MVTLPQRDIHFAGEPFNVPTPPPRKKEREFLRISTLLPFLKEEYGIVLTSEFLEEMREAHHQHSDTNFSIPTKTVDSIISACKPWKDLLSKKEDYISLICHELISMVKIHTAVLSVYFIEQAGFELVGEKPDPSYAVIVDKRGQIREMR